MSENEGCTHKLARGKDENRDVISPVICAFFTNVRVLTLVSEPEPIEPTAVDSRLRVASVLRDLRDVGKSPAVLRS